MKTEWCEVVIAILLIVFNYWTWHSQVIITILAAILIVHSFMCKKCCCCECCDDECEMPVKKKRKR